MKRYPPFFAALFAFLATFGQHYGWTELGSGATSTNCGSIIGTLCVDRYGNLYAGNINSANSGVSYIERWNGLSWVPLGTGQYPYGTHYSGANTFCTDTAGLIYAAGLEDNNAYSVVMHWNDSAWSQLGPDTGAVFPIPNDNITMYSACVDRSNNLYVAGVYSGSGIFNVGKWDGTHWTNLGGTVSGDVLTLTTDPKGNLYAAGTFEDPASEWDTTNHYWVGRVSGGQFNELLNGDNILVANAPIETLCSDTSGAIYAAGAFTDSTCDVCGTQTAWGHEFVAMWKDSLWSVVGTGSNALNANANIQSLCTNAAGILYAAGSFTDSTGHTYVAQWNGQHWAELGGTGLGALNANNEIFSVVADTSGNIYASGMFTDNHQFRYVAKYGIIHMHINIYTALAVCLGSQITLQPDISLGVPPYHCHWTTLSGDTIACNTCFNPQVTINQNSTYLLNVTDTLGDTASIQIHYNLNGDTNTLTFADTMWRLACTLDSVAIHVLTGHKPFNINWGDFTTSTDTGFLPHIEHPYIFPGNYVITATDSLGCVTSAIDTVVFSNIALQLILDSGTRCRNAGELIINATGGASPYHYQWNNADTASAIFHLQAGTYQVTVTDTFNCSFTAAYTINQIYPDSNLYVFLTGSSLNCNSHNGSASAVASGGLGPYSYLWSNGDTAQNISGLVQGNYFATVTDNAGCSASGNVSIDSACFNVITGIVYVDSSGTCNYSTGVPVASVLVQATGNNGIFYGTTGLTGRYSIDVPQSGTYQISFPGQGPCTLLSLCSDSSQTAVFTGLGDTISADFLFQSGGQFDLAIHPGWTAGNPGFNQDYWIYFYNHASSAYPGNVVLAFKYDPNLVFTGTDVPYTYYNSTTDSMVWVISGFNNQQNCITCNYMGRVHFAVPSSLPLSYQMQNQFWVFPFTGDCDTSNNYFGLPEPLTSSHDPNSKQVSPSGNITQSDSVLTYTINFQNTGTDSTHFIVVNDTLSPNLNPGSVRNIASSQPYSNFSISGNGILSWTFNPLRLPNSAASAIASQGFIQFSVNKKANLPPGTGISNSATIYFDYNTGIVTNTITDSVVDTTTFITSVAGGPVSVTAAPNPFNESTLITVNGLNEKFDFELYDLTGRLILQMDAITNNRFELWRNKLAGGLYFYRIVSNQHPVTFGKLEAF